MFQINVTRRMFNHQNVVRNQIIPVNIVCTSFLTPLLTILSIFSALALFTSHRSQLHLDNLLVFH